MRHFFVACMTIIMVLTLVPASAQAMSTLSCDLALEPGSVVKKADTSALYLVGQDKTLHVFMHQNIYNSWFNDFTPVEVIADHCFGEVEIGNPVSYRPGAVMVKNTISPSVYIVLPDYRLKKVANETVARELFGSDWNTRIVDVPDFFFSYHSVDSESLTEGTPQEGMFIRDPQTQKVYFVHDGEASELTATEFKPRAEYIHTVSPNAMSRVRRSNSTYKSTSRRSHSVIGSQLIEGTAISQPRAQGILRSSYNAMNALNSMHVDVDFMYADSSASGAIEESVTLTAVGDIEFSKCDLADFALTLEADIESDTDDVNASIEVEFRGVADQEKMYVNLSTFEFAGQEDFVSALLGDIQTDEWFHLDLSDQMRTLKCDDTRLKGLNELDIDFEDSVLITSFNPNATYNGRDAYHMTFKNSPLGQSKASSKIYPGARYYKSSRTIQEDRGELWIRKDTMLIEKVTLSQIEQYSNGDKYVVTGEIEFSDFNKDVRVQAPANSTDFMELLGMGKSSDPFGLEPIDTDFGI